MAGRTVRLDSTHWTGCACNGFDTQLPVQLRFSQLCSACVSDAISSKISKGDTPVLPHPNLVVCAKDLQNSYSSSFWITEATQEQQEATSRKSPSWISPSRPIAPNHPTSSPSHYQVDPSNNCECEEALLSFQRAPRREIGKRNQRFES